MDGNPVPDAQTSQIIKDLFLNYLSGQSLLQLSKDLNRKGVEYMPGVTDWNKARLKRLLEDRRYTGADGCPALIDAATFQAVQMMKSSRNSQSETDRKAEIYQLNVPVRCPVCGAYMKRRNDNRCATRHRWTCQSRDCNALIEKSDASLLKDLTELLNLIIADPKKISIESENTVISGELRKTEIEIGNILDMVNYDKDKLREKLYERFALAYRDIDSNPYIDKQMQAVFEQTKPLAYFSISLFNQTVSEILLQTDGTVAIMLLNHQIIKKETTI